VTTAKIHAAIPTAARVHRFTYAIRNIVAEAQKVEAAGTKVRYLNIGDPVAFGFRTPAHLIAAVDKAMRDSHNTYGPSAGISEAREAVAREYARNGFPVGAERVFITAGTSEGIQLTLGAAINAGDEVLVPMPTYPLYTAVLAKLEARAKFYRLDPSNGWMPDLDHLKSLVTSATRAIVIIDPNNPTGAVYSREMRRALLNFADQHGLLILAIPTRRSFPIRACRKRTSRPAGAPAGWRSAGRRGSMTSPVQSKSSQTDACAARCRCNTRSLLRWTATNRIRSASVRR
jgi:alanine-synthesizing transaminase